MGCSTDIKPQRWEKLDLLRFICSALVVYIHTPFTGTVGYTLSAIARIAVPLFFMLSGFFLMLSGSDKNLGKRLKRIAILILIGFVISFSVECFSQIVAGRSLITMIRRQVYYKSIFDMLVWNQPLFGDHLWYLFAYLFVIVITPVLRHKWVQPFAALLIIGNLLLGTYAPVLFGRTFHLFLNRNWLFTGIPFVCLGMIFFRYKDFLMGLPSKLILLGILLFGVGSIAESAILRATYGAPVGDVYISTVFLAVFVFVYLLDNKNLERKWIKSLAEIGRKHSLWIYILHPFVSLFFEKAAKIILKTQLTYTKSLIVYLATLILIVLFTKAVQKLQHKQ